MKKTHSTILLFLVLSLTSCANKINKMGRDVKYSAYEMVGYEKRDLFKSEVKTVKDKQEDSGKEFKSALQVLKEVYNFDGGDLEDQYEDLNDAYKSSEASAKDVKESIARLNTVAQDLFDEWEKELNQMNNKNLRSKSAQKLTETKTRFKSLKRQLDKSEAKMTPVLTKFHDQVLFIKHNLNAKAIGSLKTEGDKIKLDVQDLLQEMQKSIKEADKLIETM